MKRPYYNTTLILALSILALTSCRRSSYELELENTIKDQGGGTGTTTWSSDRTYILDGLVFVNDGQTLTIEPGTVIRARSGQGSLASALIVARGGRLIAEGRKNEPIIFTVEGDDLEGSVALEAKGLWGGLIILGNAPIHTESGEDMIEGIPVSEPRGIYGGQDEDDNSGILRYVSIRHGGSDIGEGNEINGLTLGGVGRQTTIDHVEVISNADDGVEFFGGRVNCSNMVVAYCGDDAYDIDQGYGGKGQFWLGLNGPDSNHALEISGGIEALPSLPGNLPVLQNLTLAGWGDEADTCLVHLSHYGGMSLSNSILLKPGKGISIAHSTNPGDSWSLFTNGRLGVYNCIFHPLKKGNTGISIYSPTGAPLSEEMEQLGDSLLAWGNSSDDPGTSVDEVPMLLPPTTVFENMAPYSATWFEKVSFKGAFGSNNWLEGWTLLYQEVIAVE